MLCGEGKSTASVLGDSFDLPQTANPVEVHKKSRPFY